MHPYYRWVHSTTVVVSFGYTCDPWRTTWTPSYRSGYQWVSGHYDGIFWVPGHWQPLRSAPVVYNTGYSWVPGFWIDGVYVAGYWRVSSRSRGGYRWVSGAYRSDGSYRWAHWAPTASAPFGYTWEPGYWDGEVWVGGFWRPDRRGDYRWVSAAFDAYGTYHAGYWEPIEDLFGHVWIPGWFDGSQWVDGYWVTNNEYETTDPQLWEPPEGFDSGWEEEEEEPTYHWFKEEGAPLALPPDAELG